MPPPGTGAKGDWQIATDGYFEAMGERPDSRPQHSRPPTAPTRSWSRSINEEMARRYWPGRDPIGRRLRIGGNAADRPWVTVVGIVRDVQPQRHHRCREREVLHSAHAMAHVDRQCDPEHDARRQGSGRSGCAGRHRSGRKSAQLDPNLPVADVRTMATSSAGAVDAAIHERAAGDVRRAGADAVGDRHLRRAVVPGQPAHARDRHSRRDRRGPW